MKFILTFLTTLSIFSCSQGQKKYLAEMDVQRVFAKKYDSLRGNLKDSLSKGIANVNDYNESFLTSEKQFLDSLIVDFKQKNGVQLIVFTFDSLMISKDSVDAVTQIIAFKNRINTTIGLSFHNKTMSIWMDSLINNTIFSRYDAQSIIDNEFIPVFKTGDLFHGTSKGIQAIFQLMLLHKKYKLPS